MTAGWSRHFGTCLAICAMFIVAACFSDGMGTAGRSSLLANSPNSSNLGTAAQRFAAALRAPDGSQRRLGTDDFLGATPQGALVEASDSGEFVLNLLNVPIENAANAVLGDALKRNYAIAPGVTGNVTLQTTRALSERALLETFQTVLELNGLTLRRSGGGTLTIDRASSGARPILKTNEIGVGSRIVAIPLEYISTAEMIRLLQPIGGNSLQYAPISNRNILLVSGNRSEINAAIDAVNLFDVDILKGKSIGLFKLRAAEPEAVAEELNVIFETAEGGSLEGALTILPSERLGAVLVISTRSKYLADAEEWIRNLDRTAGGTKRRPEVYPLENRAAREMEPILQAMLAEAARAEEGSATNASTVRVVADDARNAIVVWGNDGEQQAFAGLIRQLDTTATQVLLEATIAEVSLVDELNFGLRWFFEQGDLDATFTDAGSGSVGANFPGLSFLFQGPSAGATINALSAITDVNVVASPSLMVMDNQQARLQIGDEVPIATQQVRDTTDPNAPVVNTISFRDTGIILSVRPRVSSSGQVILDIEQEVSSVQNNTSSGIDSPTISQRKIKTTVVVSDGQTLALGGLIQEGGNSRASKVPGAGDVPILGALFRNKKDRFEKTELLILVTPKVVRTGSEARAVTEEFRRRLQNSNNLVGSGVAIPETGHRIVN